VGGACRVHPLGATHDQPRRLSNWILPPRRYISTVVVSTREVPRTQDCVFDVGVRRASVEGTRGIENRLTVAVINSGTTS
jgi:hypothetical protein